jgi:hypothetical protein
MPARAMLIAGGRVILRLQPLVQGDNLRSVDEEWPERAIPAQT